MYEGAAEWGVLWGVGLAAWEGAVGRVVAVRAGDGGGVGAGCTEGG